MHDQVILLDAGSGVARLLEEPAASLVQSYGALDVVLSHYHLDHVVGLSYLTAIWQNKPLTIYAPERPLVDVGAADALNQLIRPPYFPLTFKDYPAAVTLTPFSTTSFTIGEVSVRLRRQKHPGGSVGIRFGDDVAYTTDTVVDQATVDFVRGARLLLHELWLDDADVPAEEAARTGHSHAGGVVRLATEAGVKSLMIVHHHPRRTTEAIRQTAARVQAMTDVKIIIPEEGKVYEV
jgi:ribonuclease BN (tRNA processing enzyme)